VGLSGLLCEDLFEAVGLGLGFLEQLEQGLDFLALALDAALLLLDLF
jgi:hypothetical protein